ncbi:type II toxin-antitoxin system VapC family toxin [Candidatus Micrarchaeota archaeon]|nr:type II toxin-antitoxin system VapC family toxin [Candidatus Micrarchaeota archaeon]MBI5177587.1 type II toxin-antitoxin system VapC family toxin [Candidatus Micrarchaeota archaeon]
MSRYFYDTYALVEFLKGNPNFTRYFEPGLGVTCRFNLVELYFTQLRDHGEEAAERAFAEALPLSVETADDLIKKAMKFKFDANRRGKNVSYADAIGYCAALDNGLLFLTGDKEFRGLPHVEFVK